MSTFLVFSAVLAAVFAQGEHDHHNHDEHRVNVAVYYEALCSDSIAFFTKQLYPSLTNHNLEHYINLTLVPYGKSTTSKDQNGLITFKCHHGEGECRGNKLQACALRHIEDGKNSEGLGYNLMTVSFINCLMGTVEKKDNDTVYPTTKCAQASNVTNEGVIEKCQGDNEGSELLAQLGDLTNRLSPKLTSVPTIVFNNEHKAEESKLANDNFVKALCNHIQGTKPKVCNSAAFLGINSLMVLFALVSYFF